MAQGEETLELAHVPTHLSKKLSQALPGPGSSQVSFAIGVERAGVLGGITAFIGFTLPSFLIMTLLAISAHQFDAVYFALPLVSSSS